jgi:large subunit ribosomal protein L13
MESNMITQSLRKEDTDRKWVLIDARDVVLGRLSSQVASLLRGKHKPSFTPHVDNGDNVVIINAALVKLTGRKAEKKTYFRYTGWPGGDRFRTYEEMHASRPEVIIQHAVKGMLPKNRLGRKMIKKLHVYAGAEHPHTAQKPEAIKLAHRA